MKTLAYLFFLIFVLFHSLPARSHNIQLSQLTIPNRFQQINLENNKQYFQTKLNNKKTSRNVFWLTTFTLVPFIFTGSAFLFPQFQTEFLISAAISFPAPMIGWVLFIDEFKKIKKNKYFEIKKKKRKQFSKRKKSFR